MLLTRSEAFEKGTPKFKVFGAEAMISFGQMCEDLNPTITPSEHQFARAISELGRRWTAKLESRYGAPPPEERPRVQTLDLTAYLNSCKEQ